MKKKQYIIKNQKRNTFFKESSLALFGFCAPLGALNQCSYRGFHPRLLSSFQLCTYTLTTNNIKCCKKWNTFLSFFHYISLFIGISDKKKPFLHPFGYRVCQIAVRNLEQEERSFKANVITLLPIYNFLLSLSYNRITLVCCCYSPGRDVGNAINKTQFHFYVYY